MIKIICKYEEEGFRFYFGETSVFSVSFQKLIGKKLLKSNEEGYYFDDFKLFLALELLEVECTILAEKEQQIILSDYFKNYGVLSRVSEFCEFKI